MGTQWTGLGIHNLRAEIIGIFEVRKVLGGVAVVASRFDEINFVRKVD